MRRALLALLLSVPVQAQDRLVVLISADGLAADTLKDPKAPLPTLRRLAAAGAVAEGLECAWPTVTWPNHTSLVTGAPPGQHGVISNHYLDRATGKIVDLLPDPLFDKDEIVKLPTVYDAAHKAGLKTAAVIWPASRNAKTLDWTVPDVAKNDLFLKYGTRTWLDELRQEGIPVDMQEAWCKSPAGGVPRDWMYSRMAVHAITRHRPNLVLLHLVEADHAQHASGPGTPDAYWAASTIDDRVRDVVEAAGPGSTVLVVSDHGFAGYSREILPNVAMRLEGIRGAQALSEGGSALVYVLNGGGRAETLGRLKKLFRELEGVERVLEEKDYAALGLVTTDQDSRMSDLMLTAKEGYAFSASAHGESAVLQVGPKGTHGYDPKWPKMRGIFIAWGRGIRRGTRLDLIRNLDVAPTVARILGVQLPDAEGKCREEILEP